MGRKIEKDDVSKMERSRTDIRDARGANVPLPAAVDAHTCPIQDLTAGILNPCWGLPHFFNKGSSRRDFLCRGHAQHDFEEKNYH